jgi:hypothetical protein
MSGSLVQGVIKQMVSGLLNISVAVSRWIKYHIPTAQAARWAQGQYGRV